MDVDVDGGEREGRKGVFGVELTCLGKCASDCCRP